MNRERTEQIREAMAAEGIDVLLCRLPENVLLLSGYWPLCGWVFYLFPLEGKPVCILPDTEEEEARSELWDAECVTYTFGTVQSGEQFEEIRKSLHELDDRSKWKQVGYEGGFDAMAPAYNTAEQYIPAAKTQQLLHSVFGEQRLKDAYALISRERARKTPYEIEKIRVCNEIANKGLSAFANNVNTGVRAIDLAAAVEAAVMTEGTGYRRARRVRGFAQVAVGTETSTAWRPMEITSERRLKKSEVALLELAVVADGYWSDRTRARIAGKATNRQKEVWDILSQAQLRAINAVGPGVESGIVDRSARRFIHDLGYDKDFMHITGHGVGFAYHEQLPRICPDGADTLQPGMIHTVEPGIYLEKQWGMRIEDDVLVTEQGSEILGPYPHEIA